MSGRDQPTPAVASTIAQIGPVEIAEEADRARHEEERREAAKARSSAELRAHLGVGSKIGSYVVERVLGRGGMGVVVAARHPGLGETVAIKLLLPDNTDAVQCERLEREARATFRIRSEHVVRVLGVERDPDSGLPYIVMELLEGRDLAALLADRGPLPPQEVVDLVIQACDGIAAAHALGIVHRDLKPSNFFITQRPDGSPLVKVLDFGISKAPIDPTQGDVKLTDTRAIFGSPTYMSPEQIRSAKHVDARSDVWSMGVAMFELLTGRMPFIADNVVGVLAAIVTDPPARPSAFAPVPPELEAVVLACLQKDPNQRVPSIADLAARLAPFASPDAAHLALRIARAPRPSFPHTSVPPPSHSSPEHVYVPPPPLAPRPSFPHAMAVGVSTATVKVSSGAGRTAMIVGGAALAVVLAIGVGLSLRTTRADTEDAFAPVTATSATDEATAAPLRAPEPEPARAPTTSEAAEPAAPSAAPSATAVHVPAPPSVGAVRATSAGKPRSGAAAKATGEPAASASASAPASAPAPPRGPDLDSRY